MLGSSMPTAIPLATTSADGIAVPLSTATLLQRHLDADHNQYHAASDHQQ
jgi:hypothetical protein